MTNNTLEKPALDVLLDNNLHNLIQCTASKYYNLYGSRNSHSIMITQADLALEGYVGATIAYESFDPNKGYTSDIAKSFRTYAYPYIRNAIFTYCKKFCHSLSISEKAARSRLGDITSINVVHIDQLEDHEEFDIPIGSGINSSYDIEDYFFTGFNEFERVLIKDYILYDYSLSEISNRHGVSKSRAGEIIRDLLDRMKERAKNYVQNN